MEELPQQNHLQILKGKQVSEEKRILENQLFAYHSLFLPFFLIFLLFLLCFSENVGGFSGPVSSTDPLFSRAAMGSPGLFASRYPMSFLSSDNWANTASPVMFLPCRDGDFLLPSAVSPVFTPGNFDGLLSYFDNTNVPFSSPGSAPPMAGELNMQADQHDKHTSQQASENPPPKRAKR